MEKNSPQYSLYERRVVREHLDTPSPNSYHLPVLIGSRVPHKKASSAYTIPKKPISVTPLTTTPGPGAYAITFYGKRTTPKYTMTSRPKSKTNIALGPGPGKYLPVMKEAIHGGVFGLKTKQQPYITIHDEISSNYESVNHQKNAYREKESKITL